MLLISPSATNGGADLFGCCASMATARGDRSLQGQHVIDIGLDQWTERLQFVEAQRREVAALTDAECHSLADDFVRVPERDALADQIIR